MTQNQNKKKQVCDGYGNEHTKQIQKTVEIQKKQTDGHLKTDTNSKPEKQTILMAMAKQIQKTVETQTFTNQCTPKNDTKKEEQQIYDGYGH